jgi:hypothetical protein
MLDIHNFATGWKTAVESFAAACLCSYRLEEARQFCFGKDSGQLGNSPMQRCDIRNGFARLSRGSDHFPERSGYIPRI